MCPGRRDEARKLRSVRLTNRSAFGSVPDVGSAASEVRLVEGCEVRRVRRARF